MKRFLLCLGVLIGAPEPCSATLSDEHRRHLDGADPIVSERAPESFADVPADHWAYQAVKRMAAGGYIPGLEGRFQGDRPLTRYQLAIALSRIIENLHMVNKAGRVFTAEDISNLEALTIEFASELALINAKVKDLEADVDGLQRDVEQVKTDIGPRGKKAPVTGVVSARLVQTATSRPGYGQSILSPAGTLNDTQSAATPPTTRYHGDVSGPEQVIGGAAPGTSANPYRFDGRLFATLAQLSLEVDRKINKDVGIHAQFDLDGEMDDGLRNAGGGEPQGAGSFDLTPTNGVLGGAPDETPSGTFLHGRIFEGSNPGAPANGPFVTGSGRGASFRGSDVHVNEAYIQILDILSVLEARVGVQALPFNTEVNGPARTYDWTLTPSVINTHWESHRPAGVEVRESEGLENIRFNLGFYSGADRATGGTLLSGTQGPRAAGDSLTGAQGPQDPFGSSTETGLIGGQGRHPTPRMAVMSDAPQGSDGELEADGVGYYVSFAREVVAEEGFEWQLGFLDNGGKLARAQGDRGSEGDWEAFQAMARYRAPKWMAMAQYYTAVTRNYSLIDLTPGSGFVESDLRFRGSPFPNEARLNTRSEALFMLFRYVFDAKNILSLRLEEVKDETGTASLGGTFITVTGSRPLNEDSLLQLEFVGPYTRSRADNGAGRTVDVNDGLLQLNYRLKF